MGGFQLDFRKWALILFVIILPLISINMQRKEGETPWYLVPFVTGAGIVQEAYSSFSNGVRGTVSLYVNLVDVKKENRVLKTELGELKARLADLEEIKIENDRLQKLLDFKKDSEMSLLTARVIGYDLMFGQFSTIRISKGDSDGVSVGRAVVTPSGVVGTVHAVSGHFSDVMVLTNRFSAIDSVVQRSRARGVTIGNRSTTQLRYLQRSDDVQKGDLVVTSGLDNIFPKGYPIGRVTNVEKKSYGITQRVEVRPVVNPYHIEEIYVVLDAKHLDLEVPIESVTSKELTKEVVKDKELKE
ncbi:MAG: rod shape-determining protein MreC [Bdellovibrionales bacterium]|nr:rod shape-determining protein MreC [Bdellovibrionales bacterium]